MSRTNVMGKCIECEAAFYWRRRSGGEYRSLRSTRCPFCSGRLEQTSGQLVRYPWFNLDEMPRFSDPSMGEVGKRYGTHHFFTVDIRGTRFVILRGFNDQDFHVLVKKIGGHLPRGVHAHHSGTANPRSLAEYPVLMEEVQSKGHASSAPAHYHFKSLYRDEEGFLVNVYEQPLTAVEKYLKKAIEVEKEEEEEATA